jgi:hypothetical protein
MRTNPRPLGLIALLAVAAAILAGLAGRDRATPQHATAPTGPGQAHAATDKREKARRDPLLELGARFALAARNWTPATYAESWQQQIELAGGRYRRALEARQPGPVELRALREDRARSKAQLVRAQRDPRIEEPKALLLVTLNETTVAGGQTVRGLTLNQVELLRLARRWRVVGFTVRPGGATPGSGSLER